MHTVAQLSGIRLPSRHIYKEPASRTVCKAKLQERPSNSPVDDRVRSNESALPSRDLLNGNENASAGRNDNQLQSISTMTTKEWEEKYATDGCVDLWVEEEFNSGSRISGGRDAFKGQRAGSGSGEGPSLGNVQSHRIKIFNHHTDQELDVEVPEDRYILFEAEDQGLLLPWACRMGCCTTCAVKVLEGEVYQPQSLGVSKELKDQGYALMCVAYPLTDAVLETVEEDEVYDLQFGKSFAERALKKSDKEAIERDDFALEIANMDE